MECLVIAATLIGTLEADRYLTQSKYTAVFIVQDGSAEDLLDAINQVRLANPDILLVAIQEDFSLPRNASQMGADIVLRKSEAFAFNSL